MTVPASSEGRAETRDRARKQGIEPEDLVALVRDYYAVQAEEDTSTEIMTDLLLGKRDRDLTVFIPSVIVEFESFWRGLLDRLSSAGL